MIIAPQGVVYFCSGIPINNDYVDTIYFSNETDRFNFFALNHQKFKLDKYSFIREKGTLKIEKPISDCYDLNYMVYQNAGFSTKYFYAFINRVEYVNTETTLIYFETDIMQTWFPECELETCFIERQHVSDDTIGSNLVPENLETGEYVYGNPESVWEPNPGIMVTSTVNANGETVTGSVIEHIYSAAERNVFQESDANGVNAFVERVTEQNKADAIVSITMVDQSVMDNTETKVISKNYSDLDGYTPNNNKLYTYPYNFLYVTNYEGNYNELRYEFFGSDACNLSAKGSYSANFEVICFPLIYKGVAINYNEAITLSNYPQCAFTNDAYKAWLAQNAYTLKASMENLVTSTMAAPFSGLGGLIGQYNQSTEGGGNPFAGGVAGIVARGIGTGVSAYQQAKMMNAQIEQHKTLPPTARGNVQSSVNWARGIKTIWAIPATITAEFARRIDNYFSRYGYAVNEISVPNIAARSQFTFVKTVDCKIKGYVPAEIQKEIENKFNAGITFWKDTTNIGNYLVPNPVGG